MRKKKKKKVDLVPEKQHKTAYVSMESAAILSTPIGDCSHPMKILVLMGEDTDTPMLICKGCMVAVPVNFIEAGDEEE